MIRYTEGIIKDLDFNIVIKKQHRKPYQKKKCLDIFTFDIEVTSAWLDGDKIVGYKPGKPEEYWNGLQPLALPYIWMFGINDMIFYGRELSEFTKLLSELPEAELACYIHNAAYEFHFLIDIMRFKTIFSKTPHKPMKLVPENWPHIEFRCSYMLTNLSLDKWGKELGCEKKSGDLDYLKIRTPKTRLTKKELTYCEYDCLVLYTGIKKHLETYGNVFNIPLTSTGKIRRIAKELLYNIPGYAKYIKRLVPTAEIYIILRKLFAGGYTHPNRLWCGRVIRGLIEHMDFASSYPAVMCAFKFPCTRWIYRTDRFIPKDETFKKYAFIFKVKFRDIEATSFNTYIQRSKCEDLKGVVKDNGRIVSAEELTIYINEYDWMIIKKHYKWKNYTLLDSWYAVKDYLPKELIKYILQLYGNKTSYKGVAGKEDIYMLSKQYINSLFGMSVTDIVQSDVKFDQDTGNWYIEYLTPETLKKKLNALSNVYHERDRRYFVSYSWGCWVTSIARYNLWKVMDMCTDDPESPGKDVLYVDTDSIFGYGRHDYAAYDKWIVGKLEEMCRHYDLDPKLTRPLTPKGKVSQLGLFEAEDDIKEFITLHAKCYAYRTMDGRLNITVAGINKEAVDVLQDDIENFDTGLTFDKDHPSVHKNMHTYIKDMPDVIWPDGYKSCCRSGINIRPTGYTIRSQDEYEKLLEYTQYQYSDDINELILNKLKGEVDGWQSENITI